MHPSKPLHAQLAVLTQISACVLALVSTASAQTASSALSPLSPLSPLSAEREKTRASIDQVTADQVRETDTSLSLGRRLSPNMAAAVSRIEEVAARGKAPYRSSSREAGLAGLPPSTELVSPAPQRAPRRAAPVLAEGQQAPVYTPDFSRQVLSFAQLAGTAVLDLPRSDDLAVAATPAAPANDATTWGLPDILAEGLQISTVQKQALSSLEIAQSQKDQAAADWFPSAAVRLAAGSTTASPGDLSDGGYRNLSLRLTQPVFNRGLNNNLISAERAMEAAQLRRADSLQAVALTLTQATVNLAAARLTINFADEQENQLINVLRYLELRAQAGASSQADLERARTRVAAAKQTRLDQQAAYKSSLFEVERLIEQTPTALRLPFLNQLPALPATQNELLTLVRQNSAAVQALQRDVQAQQAVVAAQKAKLLPTFGLSLERDVQKNLSGEATPVNSFNRLLGVFSWQASLGGKEFYAADEAQAELRKRQSKLDEESRKLEQSVSSDFAALQSATLRITAADTEQRAALAVTDAVQAQLASGRIGNLLEALDASDRLFAARSRQIQALTQQFTAQSQLLRQIGLLTAPAAAPTPVASAPR